MKKYELIDFLKGFSIFTIVIFHYLQQMKLHSPFDKLIFFGGTGIHVFILLSGLGLFMSYLARPVSWPAFLKKRFTKIYFPYIIVVLVSACISLVIPIYKNSLYALGGHIFLYKMFDESIIGSYGYPLWFISMIIQFYLVFYLLVYYRKSTTLTVFFISCLIISLGWSFLVMMLGKGMERVWNSFFLQYLWEFALGMVIGEKLFNNQTGFLVRIRIWHFIVAGIAGCFLYAALALMGGGAGKLFNDIPALAGYSSVAIFIYMLKIKPVNRFFLFTGEISYSFYLLHMLILLLMMYLLRNLYFPATLIMSLLLTYVISYFYQKFILRLYRMMGI